MERNVIAPECVLRAFDSGNYDLVQPYRVKDDALMPLAYRRPAGRFLHDDWAVFKDTPRISTAYRVPLPFKQVQGSCSPQWLLWDPSYPASPNLRIENRDYSTAWGVINRPHALVDQAVEGSGYATFAAWLDGKWVPVFQSYRKVIFGRLLAKYTGGLKQDVTVTPQPDGSIKSDIMGWWDPSSLSYNKVA